MEKAEAEEEKKKMREMDGSLESVAKQFTGSGAGVAGETGVNFFSVAASQFVEVYVGVGAARIRSLYQDAKENAPSIIYIDELDSIGRVRGSVKGVGGKEEESSLNQLLVCLDGFEGRGDVITIASTNMPALLDPALVRPGRFDRKIHIPKPGLQGRIEILKVHARSKRMAPEVDFADVAALTDGMVGAEMANIVEVAAIRMTREGRIKEMDKEALRIIDDCYERAKGILERNREVMDAVVDSLVEKKSLTREEFFDLVELHGEKRD